MNVGSGGGAAAAAPAAGGAAAGGAADAAPAEEAKEEGAYSLSKFANAGIGCVRKEITVTNVFLQRRKSPTRTWVSVSSTKRSISFLPLFPLRLFKFERKESPLLHLAWAGVLS